MGFGSGFKVHFGLWIWCLWNFVSFGWVYKDSFYFLGGMKWGYGSKSRCRQSSVVAVAEETEGIDEGLVESYWANLPSELLREVLMRIEDTESKWPFRKNVVACAGVCRSWREIMKELVRTPEVSGKLTFPISVKQVKKLSSFKFITFIWL